jgi:hypothetical protein
VGEKPAGGLDTMDPKYEYIQVRKVHIEGKGKGHCVKCIIFPQEGRIL